MPKKRQSADDPAVRAFGERIDEAATKLGVETTQIAAAAGVTWAAAKRWRQGRVWPALPHAAAIARVLGMTLDELIGEDGYEPPYPAWRDFKTTPTFAALTSAQRRRLAILWFDVDEEPTLEMYIVMAAGTVKTRKAS